MKKSKNKIKDQLTAARKAAADANARKSDIDEAIMQSRTDMKNQMDPGKTNSSESNSSSDDK